LSLKRVAAGAARGVATTSAGLGMPD